MAKIIFEDSAGDHFWLEVGANEKPALWQKADGVEPLLLVASNDLRKFVNFLDDQLTALGFDRYVDDETQD
jgi:hypothetical protein